MKTSSKQSSHLEGTTKTTPVLQEQYVKSGIYIGLHECSLQVRLFVCTGWKDAWH